MSDLPLKGVRIADFTQALSGPYCTLQLADLGADVIKVERSGTGDDTRHWGPPFVGDTAAYFLSINRNKRSIDLNLKDQGDLDIAKKLIASADVMVENWRPGTAERLGLGYEAVSATHPQLVYCSISGYGADDSRTGYDQVVQGTSGWMSLTGAADGEPFKTGVPIADVASGMFAANGILAALVRRAETGRGGFVDIAMQDSLMSMFAYHAGSYFATGIAPKRNGNQHPTVAPYGTFSTKDGVVNISVGNDRQWANLCTALGIEGGASDPRFATNADRLNNRTALHELIDGVLAHISNDEVLQAASVAGVPAGAIQDLNQAFNDPRSLQRGMVLESEHPRLGTLRSAGSAWHLDGETATAYLAPPDLGAHKDEILAELGFALQGEGAIRNE